jgi:hypothetical protein
MYSFYHATCEQVKTASISTVLSMSDAGGTLTYLSCLGNNFIEQWHGLQTGCCVGIKTGIVAHNPASLGKAINAR